MQKRAFWFVFAGLVGLQTVRWPTPAAANCEYDDPELLWSYPAEDATDVPTNAVLWALVTGGWIPTVYVDDVVVEAERLGPAFRIAVPTLAPETDHTLTLVYPPFEGEGDDAPDTLRVAFRTGSDVATMPAAPEFLGQTDQATEWPHEVVSCDTVINTQDCFDTGGYVVRRFQTRASDALAWFVSSDPLRGLRQLLWPADCGDASLVIREREDTCMTLRAIGPGGLWSEPVRSCPPAVEDPDAGVADAGVIDAGTPAEEACNLCDDVKMGKVPASFCSLSPGRTARGAWMLIALAAVVALRRRQRR